MSDTCIINYATGEYIRGQMRLEQECRAQGYDGDFLLFNENNILPNCPKHHLAPYAFKPYAMKEAQANGYRYLLWCDSSVYPVAPIDRAFAIIREVGYMFLPGGWNTGQWCSDQALVTLGITREEAFKTPHMVAGCQGLDLNKTRARQYLDRYYELANDGVTFIGVPGLALSNTYTNEQHQVRKDEGVKGHRHDQTAASITAWKLGMRDWKPNVIMYDQTGTGKRKDTTIFLVRSA